MRSDSATPGSGTVLQNLLVDLAGREGGQHFCGARGILWGPTDKFELLYLGAGWP